VTVHLAVCFASGSYCDLFLSFAKWAAGVAIFLLIHFNTRFSSWEGRGGRSLRGARNTPRASIG